jgi:hypothetical protein
MNYREWVISIADAEGPSMQKFDTDVLKDLARSVWARGGMDALVKVCPPDGDVLQKTGGYATTFKYVVGRVR